jgi:hypothetical protein
MRFSTQPIPEIACCSVGKDAMGYPVLLIETAVSGPRDPVVPIVLEHLSILHNVECRMQNSSGGTTTRFLSVVRCCGKDSTLQEYFLRTLTPVIASLVPNPTREQVVQAVNRLIELFRYASQAARKSIQGLWAELFVIQRSGDPSFLLRCWHTKPEERYDFAESYQRVEVKTAAGRVRAHRFSHEQLRPPTGTLAMIVSILIDRSAGGQNIYDLIDDIRKRVSDADLLIRLDSMVADTLGNDWRAAHEERFDHQFACESCRFLDARTVPSVAGNIPPEVTDVHFRVDLSAHPLALPVELTASGGLFAAMLPP